MSHLEQMIENQFIQILSEKENQWTYRPDLKSEEALWQNFRSHLNRISLAVLGEQLLTDKEFKQVKVEFSRLTGTPFYKSASSRLLKKEFPIIRQKLWKEMFWSQSFCLLSSGGAPIEVIKEYIENQGQKK